MGIGLGSVIWAIAFAFVLHTPLPLVLVSAAPKKTYMVQIKYQPKPALYNTQSEWYSDLFQSLTSAPQDSLLYTYEAAYHGFAAALSPEQAESLRQSESVLGVHEDTLYTLHTTRSPNFLHLDDPGLWPGHGPEELNKASQDVVIGVLDTGVWPESPSFRDGEMSAVPARWRGKCEWGDPKIEICNRKLIGVRFFDKGYNMRSNESRSARDLVGHGTHTASTAAGSQVADASLFGYAKGTARGMAKGARLAAYKVCWASGCSGSDIVAAIDSAISDGVDVLSMSLGGTSAQDYALDPLAVGAFAAMERGIFVSCSAGNNGPSGGSVTNVAPWIMTVGAGTIDRDFPSFVALGNGMKYTGVSLYSGPDMGSNPVELVYGGGNDSSSSQLCLSLDPSIVRGKVVLCDRGTNARAAKGVIVKNAGGIGMILANTEESGGEELVADSHFCPAVTVANSVGNKIRKYVNMTQHPTALLSFGGTVVKVKPSPVVAAFSSRGMNWVTQQILKPDVIGPGVNILAAWSGVVGPTSLPEDTRKTAFNIISGKPR
ncbi:subtilisin-like protease [Phtheirospermum japonicum]|uniref:Subtilisin-like protease n=1 Tax=Phtheirospermum japonicum TaxID=374723 RepID=A0A830BHZ9_9LAMI|nr:subtilisin-like protease [Phtheirospermum japonicum]